MNRGRHLALKGHNHVYTPRLKHTGKIYTESYLWEFVGNGYKTAPPLALAKRINRLNKGYTHSYISLVQTLTGGKCKDIKLGHGLIKACMIHYPDMKW